MLTLSWEVDECKPLGGGGGGGGGQWLDGDGLPRRQTAGVDGGEWDATTSRRSADGNGGDSASAPGGGDSQWGHQYGQTKGGGGGGGSSGGSAKEAGSYSSAIFNFKRAVFPSALG